MNDSDALLHLAGAMMMGASEYIEHQEKQGQTEVCQATQFPLDIAGASKDELEAIGFVFGETIDELFQECTLPEGWKIEPTDHSMWSDIVDNNCNKRGGLFYKAVFYDRCAFATFCKDN